MTRLALLFRNLWYFRGVNFAVIAGVAVSTAVLTGALMVGDSVRGSLADLARLRLGPVDYALISPRFFDQSLPARINADSTGSFLGVVAPATIVRGGAASEAGDARTADVQIAAVGPPAKGLAAIGGPLLPVEPGGCILNGELAAGLGVTAPGKTILLSVPTQSDVPRESALAKRGRNDVQNELRASVSSLQSQPGFLSLFNPNGSQRVPRNAWVNLGDLQSALDQPGRINAMLVSASPWHGREAWPPEVTRQLNERLRQVIRLDDYGLSLLPVGDGEVSLFARETYLAPPAVDAARRAASVLNLKLREVSVNLISSITNASSNSPQPRVIRYAVAAGISSLDDGPLGDDEAAINQWTADQLGAKVGDKLKIDFYLRQPGGDLVDASTSLPSSRLTFIVKQVLPMTGLGADPKLPPNYKGLTDAKSVADWDPPEELKPKIDKTLVTKADEKYWDQYRAAPKLFVNIETARKLWGGVYGEVTGLRVPAAGAEVFGNKLLAELQPQSMGLTFRADQGRSTEVGIGRDGFFDVLFDVQLLFDCRRRVAGGNASAAECRGPRATTGPDVGDRFLAGLAPPPCPVGRNAADVHRRRHRPRRRGRLHLARPARPAHLVDRRRRHHRHDLALRRR